MINNLTECPTTQKDTTASRRHWSAGIFSAEDILLPEACLVNCLEGDPDKAATHGCAMIKQLVRRVDKKKKSKKTFNSQEHDAPKVCGQGYAVTLYESEDESNPDTLILCPSYQASTIADSDLSAIRFLQSTLTRLWKLNRENNGLAEEVLRSYEQINLIFDVSAEIATLSDTNDVRRVLLTKLRHLFNAEAVFLISADERTIIKVTKEGGFTHQTNIPHKPPETDLLKFNTTSLNIINNNKLGDSVDSIELPPEFNRAKKQLRESQQVLVCATDPLYEQSGHGTSMWGPLKENDDRFAIIGITRRETSFVAGDMLLFDSALTFGGNILSNLHLIEQLKQTSFESVRALVNALDQKDSYTCGHAERVGFLAKVTGQHMNLSITQLQTLEWAGLLHDVGKIGIPEEVLNKPGSLSPEEFALIKEHSSRGYEVLKPVASLEPVLEVVLYHHESPDGTGYPTELKGDEIPLLARIIHVVDVFDALTSTRSYRQSYNFDQAVEILKKDAGIKLDAEIVTSFIEVWSQLPNTHPEEYERWFGLAKETKT